MPWPSSGLPTSSARAAHAEEIAKRVGTDPEATFACYACSPDIRCFPIGRTASSGSRRCPTRSAKGCRLDARHRHPDRSPHPLGRLRSPVYSVRTGEASMPKLRGMGAYEFFMANPEYAGCSSRECAASPNRKPTRCWRRTTSAQFREIVDVSAGPRHPAGGDPQQAPGIHTASFRRRAARLPMPAPCSKRLASPSECRSRTATYFDKPAMGADAYVLKHILHDFAGIECLALLRICAVPSPPTASCS